MFLLWLLSDLKLINNIYQGIYVNSGLEGFLLAFIFSLNMKKRKFYWLYVLLSFVVFISSAYLFAWIRTITNNSDVIRMLFTLLTYVMILGCFFLFSYDDPLEIILKWIVTLTTRDLVDVIWTELFFVLGLNPRVDYQVIPNGGQFINNLIYDGVHYGLFFLFYFVFRKKETINADKSTRSKIALLTLMLLLFITVAKTFVTIYSEESLSLYFSSMLIIGILCIAIYFLRFSIINDNHQRQEILVMDQVLDAEQKQYLTMKENIDIINMKAHDIKHQLDNMQSRLSKEDVTRLKNAANIYDKTWQTGSQVLDTILYGRQLKCNRLNIQITCLADGKILRFIDASHLYYLFENIVDNAIEAVSKVDDPDKRIIAITVSKDESNVYIRTCNFFKGELTIENGKMETSKKDKEHHGYGMKSINYIVDEYNGRVRITTKEDMFFLDIFIPIQPIKSK